MDVIIFLGPSLPPEDASAMLPAHFRPPAAQGDLMRAAMEGPKAIGLVDGVFEYRPAVWHKEILWAMSAGIHVYGGASIGALRAAELAAFGMRGVGRIFEAYADGTLEDDDEVAVLHGPRALGYRPLTDALVDMRATLDRARHEGIIPGRVESSLVALAKSHFYKERHFDRLWREAAVAGVPAHHIEALRIWLPRGRVDRKRLDALEMLMRMRELLEAGPKPKTVDYRLEETQYLATMTRAARRSHEQDPREGNHG